MVQASTVGGPLEDARILERFIGADEIAALPTDHAAWLEQIFSRHGGMPSLESLWAHMDEAWRALGCDSEHLDGRIEEFYRHPVWLLNTLFIEHDAVSLAHRRSFADRVARYHPARVADVGGGGGTLARAIASASAGAHVHIVEPHPHPLMVRRLASVERVAYVPALDGAYDFLVATDVFEHLPDPVQMLADLLVHVRPGGHCLFANCFWPVIACHLPQLFHFRHSWDLVCTALGLAPGARVAYGRVYRYTGETGAAALQLARQIEAKSRRHFGTIERLPQPLASRAGRLLLRLLP